MELHKKDYAEYIETGKYVEEEKNGKVTYTSKIKDALSFTIGDEDSEADAESTLELLNDLHEDGFSLVETLSAIKPNTSLAGIFSQIKFLISY